MQLHCSVLFISTLLLLAPEEGSSEELPSLCCSLCTFSKKAVGVLQLVFLENNVRWRELGNTESTWCLGKGLCSAWNERDGGGKKNQQKNPFKHCTTKAYWSFFLSILSNCICISLKYCSSFTKILIKLILTFHCHEFCDCEMQFSIKTPKKKKKGRGWGGGI